MTFAVVAGLGCTPEPEPTGARSVCESQTEVDSSVAPHPRARQLQLALEEAVNAGLPGAVMAIRDQDGVWEGSAGLVDLGRGDPMQTCHRTRIASVTKTFVAVTVLALAEQGLLDLDATLSEVVPEKTRSLRHADEITVAQLLNHTSGVYNFLDVEIVLELFNRPNRTWTTRECYDHALTSDPEFSPGRDWSYSNTNYLLLAWVIEAVTEQPQADVVAEQILEPLQLTNTRYHVDDFRFDGVAHGYFDLLGDRTLVDSTETYANLCVGADGGMVSTAGDLLMFYDHLLARRDLLNEASLEEMMPRVETNDDEFPNYGYGLEAWGEEGPRRGIGHGGHEFGYRTFAYYFPERDVTFVLWFNASSLLPNDQNIAAVINRERGRLRDVALGLE